MVKNFFLLFFEFFSEKISLIQCLDRTFVSMNFFSSYQISNFSASTFTCVWRGEVGARLERGKAPECVTGEKRWRGANRSHTFTRTHTYDIAPRLVLMVSIPHPPPQFHIHTQKDSHALCCCWQPPLLPLVQCHSVCVSACWSCKAPSCSSHSSSPKPNLT